MKDTGSLDAADDWIAERIGPGDIAVTDDIILASRCLEKGGSALNTRGRRFTPDSIGSDLANRELMANLREAGTITGGPAGFTKSDRSNFLQELDLVINVLRRSAQR